MPWPLAVTENSTGVAVTISSATTQIPNNAAGNVPAVIRVAVTTLTHILLGGSGDSVANTTGMIVGPDDSLVLYVSPGQTHVAHIRDSADGRISITAVENWPYQR